MPTRAAAPHAWCGTGVGFQPIMAPQFVSQSHELGLVQVSAAMLPCAHSTPPVFVKQT